MRFLYCGRRCSPSVAADQQRQRLRRDRWRDPIVCPGSASPAGRVSLTLPAVAENGNAVPITVEVDSAFDGSDRVASIMVLADGNPRPEIATFHFTELSASAAVTTRIRLARTQSVIALAKMVDGSIFMDRKQVEVTIGGCTG